MEDTPVTKTGSNQVDPEAKYKRLQEIGLSHWLAIPVALMTAATFGYEAWYGHISIALGILGALFFFFGLVGRQELADRQAEDDNSPDCPK